MQLIIAASEAAALDPPANAWVVRLAGVPHPDETPPPGLTDLADKTAQEIRQRFPLWLWNWCQHHAVPEIHLWPGPISWWWYTPLSEKSPLRTRLLRDIYWLTLFRQLLLTQRVDSVEWRGGDTVVASAARKLALSAGVSFRKVRARWDWRESRGFAAARRFRFLVLQTANWILLKTLGYGRLTIDSAQAVLFTLFPSLWEFDREEGRSRMYSHWSETLARQNCPAVYALAYSGSPIDLIRQRKRWLGLARQKRFIFIESLLSFKQWASAHLRFAFFFKYLYWRLRHRHERVTYLGIDITRLWWRELDGNALSPEIPFDVALFYGMQNLLKRFPAVRTVFQHFEYQPMERALLTGVRSVCSAPVIGIQAGVFTSNQMGFTFPLEETRSGGADPLKAPLPDYLAAYGTLPYQVFSARFPPNRVCLDAALRYAALFQTTPTPIESLQKRYALPEEAVLLAVTTPLAREEALYLLDGALHLLAENPQFFLLIKFHYHTPLHASLDDLAKRYKVSRFRLFGSDLYSLLRSARMLLTAGSSTAVEAIALGCMPLFFRSIGELACNPMLDTPEAVFFWQTRGELRQAARSCMEKDLAFREKQAHWPAVLSAQLSTEKRAPDETLSAFLQERGVLSGTPPSMSARQILHESH